MNATAQVFDIENKTCTLNYFKGYDSRGIKKRRIIGCNKLIMKIQSTDSRSSYITIKERTFDDQISIVLEFKNLY